MGYYSEVAFACSKEDYLVLDQEMKDKGFDLFERTYDLGDFEVEGKPWIWLRWDYIKWYPNFKDIEIIKKYMRNPDNKYQFMRLGEDYEEPPEILNSTDECDWFSIYRTIEVNV